MEITKQQIKDRLEGLEKPRFQSGTFAEMQELLKDFGNKLIELEDRLEALE